MSRDGTPLDKVAELLSIARFTDSAPGEELADAIDKLVCWRIEAAVGVTIRVFREEVQNAALGLIVPTPDLRAELRKAWGRDNG